MAAPFPQLRQDLSMPGLLKTVRGSFARLADPRKRPQRAQYTLTDTLCSALAMFSLKYPSLLQFDTDVRADVSIIRPNLRTLYGVENAPCDTQMRAILDPLQPQALRPVFRALHSQLQRGNLLSEYSVFGGAYLLSIDGTGVFSSTQISCQHCCQKQTRNGTEYYHQLLGAVIVHPDRRTVLPLDFEPITRADGAKKNDCERNAAKRLIASIAAQYPKRRFVVIEDALAANGPHLELLQAHRMDFIIGVKPDGNASLFDAVHARSLQGLCSEWEAENGRSGYRFINNVPLNHSHPDLKGNFLEYWQLDAQDKEQIWSWVTSLEVTEKNAMALSRAARARWKIENETFNTLKNQGYHFEHNFGHGQQYLSSVLAGLMLLAFLIDQIQEQACRVFQQARERLRARTVLWERLRGLFLNFLIPNWEALMRTLAAPGARPAHLPIPPGMDSS